MPRRELTETDIRNIVRTLIDPLIVKFREQIFGSGISFSPKISVTVIPDSFGELSDSSPQSITDSTNSPGSSDKSSRDDHTHSHGNRGGGSLHSYATTGVPGFTTLAALGATTSGTVVQAQDTRLSNARTPSGAAGGDLSSTYPNPTVSKIQGNAISSTTPTNGQSLVWSSSNNSWTPTTISGSTASGISGGYTQGARVYNNSNLTVATSTEVRLTFNSERYDTDNIHSTSTDTGRLTCQTAGKYMIGGSARSSGGSIQYLALILNGTTYICLSPSVNTNFTSISTLYELAAGDYVELFVNSTGSTITSTANYSPEFWMQRVG